MSVDVIGVQEYSSIAAGVLALDAVVKAAPVAVLAARVVTPGKLVLLFTGDVASVAASLAAGREAGAETLLDELFIPNLHPRVIPAIRAVVAVREWDALGIIEGLSVAAGIEAADAAAKEAEVEIPEIRLSGGMGGKSTVKLMGPLRDVQAAVRAGTARVQAGGRLCRQVVIPRPHPDIRSFVLPAAPEEDGPWS
ncbi:MAG: BMC domain-containing protein [Thermoanaerobaculaceae bacterium]|nr:BMC domain-containing protein [Thermoanaerobaculaceae bacterium]